MNPNSPDARRLIMEFEQKKREKLERREQQEEFQEQIKSLMNMKMLEVVDPKSGGMQKGPGNMDHLVAAGIARAVQGFDEKGNPVMKYEPIANPLYAQQQQTSSNSNSIEWARLFLETMNATLARQSEMPKFAESLLNSFITKMPMQTDPVEQLVNTKKVLDTIAPAAGGAMNLDIAKYNLAQERLKTDREFAMMAAQREHEKVMYERQRDERMEQASAQNMSEIVKSIFSIGKDAFLPVLQLLTRGNMPGAGGINPMAAAMMVGQGGMPPGMQPQPQPQQVIQQPRPRPRPRPQYTDEEQRFAPRYNAAPASNDNLGYGRPQQQQQQQPQPQVVQNTSGTVRQYSPQDFATMDINTLENLKLKGYNSRASIDSFNSAVQAAIAQKKIAERQSPEPITQYVPPSQEQPVVEQTTTTVQTQTNTLTTDRETAADLQEATIEENEELKRPVEQEESAGDIAE
jgi:hypothetical protein